MHQICAGVLLAGALILTGCGNPPTEGSSNGDLSEGPQGNNDAIKSYTAADLPAVGDRLPPLDGGRVEFAPPAQWQVLPRDSKYLARFVKEKEASSLPRITVTAEQSPEGVEEITVESVAEFSALMQARSEEIPGRKLAENERPIVLGAHPWSRHVRKVALNRKPTIVQSLATVHGGRLYVIELAVPSLGDREEDLVKAILAHRDAAYAVAASWSYVGSAAEDAGNSTGTDIGKESSTAEVNPATEP